MKQHYIKGDRVVHCNHGKGTFQEYDDSGLDDCFVEFDEEPEGWYNPLFVSIDCLAKIEG